MKLFKKMFGKKKSNQEKREKYYEDKEFALEQLLGKKHYSVLHSVITFEAGGGVDLYLFPNHIDGTGFATMELLEMDGSISKPNKLGTYELVAFTKKQISPIKNEDLLFTKISNRVFGAFTTIAYYSEDVVLNPGNTLEIPMENEENWCFVLDKYPKDKDLIINKKKHHLLLCLEIFRSEMEYARKFGSDNLFRKLKEAGHYPYLDLDREAVA